MRMMGSGLVLVLGLSLVMGAMVPTPGQGPRPAQCVHRVPSGARIERGAGGELRVAHSSWSLPRSLPACSASNESTGSLDQQPRTRDDGLPLDYNGWLAYTAVNTSDTFDSFVSRFTVPEPPRELPQIVYLFPGVQNIDWIPKHDPESAGQSFDILQPVLQYPGDAGRYWSFKSWYVTLDSGAVESTEVRAEPGDVILGNMTRTGTESWLIITTNERTGLSTSIHATHARLTKQPWAYCTLETYGVAGCSQLPSGNSTFLDMTLMTPTGPVQPQWVFNPKPDPEQRCSAAVAAAGNDLVFTFQP